MSDFKWYTLHTQVGYEEKVKTMIENKLNDESLTDSVEEIFVPFEEVIEVKKKKRETVKKCLYPSYVFIKAKMSDKLYNLIKKISIISGFVGSKNEPIPLEDAEMDAIFEKMERSKKAPRLSVSFKEGESVRILNGPFANFTGTIEEVDIYKGRLKILISIFGRSTPVELDYNQVEKVE